MSAKPERRRAQRTKRKKFDTFGERDRSRDRRRRHADDDWDDWVQLDDEDEYHYA